MAVHMTPTNWTPWEQLPADDEAFMAVVTVNDTATMGVGIKHKSIVTINGRFAWDYSSVVCWVYLKDLVTLPELPSPLYFRKGYNNATS